MQRSKVRPAVPLGRAAAVALESLEHRLLFASTILGSPNNTTSASAGVTPQFDWLAPLVSGNLKSDLIVANSTSSISVLLSNGTGGFTTPGTTYPVTGTPLPIATGQLVAGSSNVDIVVGTTGSPVGDISVLIGNGDGTFQQATNYSALGSNRAIAIGNFVNGGPADIITISNTASTTNNIALCPTDGAGHITAVDPFSVGHGGLGALAVGDFNGDGNEDIAVLSQTDSTISVLLGNGNGTFQTPVDYHTGNSPTSVAVGDFNGDSKLDLVTANSTAGTVSFLAGNGNGTFAAKVDTAVAGSAQGGGPLKVRVADFNGDNKSDLLVLLSPGGTGDATILLGQGNGTFQNIQPITTGGATRTGLAVGDLNGDGLTDVLLSDSTTLTTLLNVTPTDTTPPSASVDATQAAASNQSTVYDFTVTYTDAQQVDASTIATGNLTVTAPTGVTFANGSNTMNATLVSTGLVSGPTVQAKYELTFASDLTTSQNGTYTVAINSGSVANAHSVPVPAGAIGTLTLNVGTVTPPPPTTPSGDLTPSAPRGKLKGAVVAGSKQGGVSVVVVNTSGKILAGKNVITVTLHSSASNIVDTSATALQMFTKKVKNLKPGKGFVAKFKPFLYPSTPGSYYLVADATVNGTADSYDGATATPIVDAAAFVDVKANLAAPAKALLTAGTKNVATLNVTNLGNVAYNGGATVAVYASTTGVLDGSQTQIASVPVTLHINPSQSKNVKVTFIPTTLPASGTYNLIMTITVPGDNNSTNDTVASSTTVAV